LYRANTQQKPAMLYLVDANNLACQAFGTQKGKPVEDFDLKLIELLTACSRQKNKKWALVFDSPDPYGDKYEYKGLTVMYVPRDQQYSCADDRIIELAGLFSGRISKPSPPVFLQEAYELTVVTDDSEIRQAVDGLAKDSRRPLHLQTAADLAGKLVSADRPSDKQDDSSRDLSEEEVNDINRELLDIWQ